MVKSENGASFFFVFVLFMFCCYRVWENEEVEKCESKENRLTIEKKKKQISQYQN